MREYQHILKPSVAYLESCGCFLLDTRDMAEFLGIPAKAVQQMAWTGRIPIPIRLGAVMRWNIIRLLEWVESGCPRLKGR
jgi:hypothetical protein